MADSVTRSSGPPGMLYSPAGSKLASGAIKKARGLEKQQALDHLWQCFDSIERSPDTTPDEKHLAQLGKSFSTGVIKAESLLRARMAIAEAITKASPGPLAPVLSTILLDATEGSAAQGDIQNILWYGLDSMQKAPDLTHEEKQRVSLALDISSSVVSSSTINTCRRMLLSSIAASVQGPAGPIIASICQDALQGMSSKDATSIQWYSFEAIKNDPMAAPEERELGAFGQQLSTSCISPESLTTARKAIMDLLRKPVADPMALLYARAAGNALQGASAKDAANISWYFLDAITKHKSATQEQKALADLGLNFSSTSMSVETVASSRSAILRILGKPLAEALPVILPKAAMEAAQGAKNQKDRMNIYWYGLDAMAKCAESDATQVILANLGKNCSTTSMAQDSIVIIRDCIIKALVDPEPQSAGRAIAGVVLHALGGIPEPRDMNNLLWYGFDAINQAPGATGEQKALAARGANINATSVKDSAQARKRIMEKIALSSDPLQELREMAENLMKTDEPDAVEVQDGMLIIDGLKLEIRKEPDMD